MSVSDPLPENLSDLLTAELTKLHDDDIFAYGLSVETRKQIWTGLGPSNHASRASRLSKRVSVQPASMTFADIVRAYIQIATAEKLLPLWSSACDETERLVGPDDPGVIQQQHQNYQKMTRSIPIEKISVYDVPRKLLPVHILKLATLVLEQRDDDFEALLIQANDLWNI